MSGKHLLDTNIIIGIFKNDKAILARLRKTDGVFIPAIALGELHYGTRKSTRVEENLGKIEQFVAVSNILFVDEETAYWYGIVKDQLRRIGKPIPENDIWIAAIAMQKNIILATRDKHFQAVENLQTEMW